MDESVLTELLECSVCLEQLDHTSKVLPCQHTFCRRCLDEIHSTKHELRCPECRFLVEIAVEDLPSNILLIRLLEGIKSQSRGQPGTRRSRGQDQGVGLRADNSVGAAAFARQQQLNRQGATASRPCAEAVFSYEGKDPGDLSFKKGDLVYLRKQVDENWYHGEMNGQHGFFPASYVKVKLPLPVTLPQCVGLYDFEVDETKEKDCLPFKKEETVTVIRQVDENWLEGKKGDKIGIFPISFVKLNEPARKLLSLFGNGIQEFPEQDLPPEHPAHPVRTPKEGSPVTLDIAPHTKPQNKRHSLTSITGLPTTNPASVQQRHSLEITSDTDLLGAGAPIPAGAAARPLIPLPVVSGGERHDEGAVASGQGLTEGANVTDSQGAVAEERETTPKTSDITATADMTQDSKLKDAETAGPVDVRPNIPPPSDMSTPQLAPVRYIAMYNYKPQKADELELHKGDYYTVVEKCQDGWYKGQCLKSGIAGVFPGNYVNLCSPRSSAVKVTGRSTDKVKGSPETGSCQDHTNMPSPASSPSLTTGLPLPPRPKTSPGRASSADRESIPPPIVPRSAKMPSPHHHLSSPSASRSSPTSSSGSRQNSPLLGAQGSKLSSSKLPKPASPRDTRGSRHDASPQAGLERPGGDVPTPPPQGAGSGSGSSVSPVWKHSMSVNANITPPNVALGTKGRSPPGLSGSEIGAVSHPHTIVYTKEKDKKEKKDIKDRLIQMKRLATGKGKKSKHSPSDTYADGHVSHSRSGSYPSDGSSSDSGPHRKTASYDTSTPPKPSRPKPLVRERYRCVETYPPQSEMELDLKIGDIIYVHKKRDDGWYKGTLQRSGKTGLFPGIFVEKCD